MTAKEQLDKVADMPKPRSDEAIARADERKKQRSKLFLGNNSSVEKKYKLTDETTVMYGSTTLHRIQALMDFSDVKKGDFGGFVESEKNLSQYGNCWIYDNAKVFDNARVFCDAQVFENAKVLHNARVFDDAKIFGNAQVYGHAWVYATSQIFGDALVFDNAKVFENAKVFGNARVCGNSVVYDACVYEDAMVFDVSTVHGNACVCGKTHIYGKACIGGNAKVSSDNDYIVFKNWWSSKRYFTWTRSNDMWTCGCFHGTGKELIEKAYKDSEVSGREYERIVNYVESIKSEINKF